MTDTSRDLLQSALGLPEGDRAAIAAALIESLDPLIDEDREALWDKEIARRVAGLDSGAVQTVPWPEARQQILRPADDAAAG
jgi:hypothetical protein